MQENEFEKQVRQRMDGFRLRPSEPVWMEIEKELKDKRRRRFLLFPLLALLIAAGYLTWHSGFRDHEITSIETTEKKSSDKDQPKKSGDNQDQHLKNTNTRAEDELSVPEDKTAVVPVTGDLSSAIPNAEKVTTKNHPGSGSKTVTGKANIPDGRWTEAGKVEDKMTMKNTAKKVPNNESALVTKPDHRTHPEGSDQSGIVPVNKNVDPGHVLPANEHAAGRTEMYITPGKSLVQDRQPVIIDDRLFHRRLLSDSLSGNKIAGLQLPPFKSLDRFNSSRAIRWGMSFSLGASSRVNKPLQVVSSLDKSAAASSLAAGGNGQAFNNFGGGVAVLPPSSVTAGTAFKAGVIVAKPLSRRFELSAGLQYSYASDHIRVGKSLLLPTSSNLPNRDVAAQAYYPNVQNVNHTNKYHFIEMPVAVSFTVNRNWKSPFVWNAGVSASRLLSSDVLLYDITWGGIYYKGDKDINKTQVTLSTGFSIRFTGRNRWQWSVGPQVYSGLTRLFQSEYDKNKHPVSGGLNVRVLLPAGNKHR